MAFGVFWLIPIVAIIGGITTAVVATITKGRIRELEIRERIAMIERGLVPPPEVDPRGFERVMDHVDLHEYRGRYRASGRFRRAGVTVMGVGFALMVLIGFTAGEPAVAFGVGGAFVIVGFAIFLNGLFDRTETLYANGRPASPYVPPPPPIPTSAPPPPGPPLP